MSTPLPRSQRPDFESLVHELHRDVWLLCRHLGDADSAEDLAQETFLRAYKALPGFRGESTPRTWLFSIARRVCADHVRRVTRERSLMEKVREVQHHQRGHRADIGGTHSLWDLVDRLGPDRRGAFVLTQVLGLSYEETAKVFECPIGTVRSRVARARTDLVDALRLAEQGSSARSDPAGHWSSRAGQGAPPSAAP